MVSSFLFFNHFSGFLLDHFLVLVITQKLKSPKPDTGSCKGVSTVKIGSIYGALNARPSICAEDISRVILFKPYSLCRVEAIITGIL